jgi:hypothetical protein
MKLGRYGKQKFNGVEKGLTKNGRGPGGRCDSLITIEP